MKTKFSVLKHMAIILSGTLIFIAGCYQFDFVIQPHSAELNSSFEVQVSVTMNSPSNNYQNFIGYFGIQLPEDWTMQDSIYYESDTNWGYFTYSQSLTNWMGFHHQPPEGYKWWVGKTSDSVTYIIDDTFLFSPLIETGNIPGNYYLTYFVSDSDNGIMSEYTSWSYNNLITAGLPDHIEVTNSNDSGPGSLRSAIDSINFNGTITFNLNPNDTIILNSRLDIFKDLTIAGNENAYTILSGNDSCCVFYISHTNPTLSNLAIINGNGEKGGGLNSSFNAPILKNLLICNNIGELGGGIHFYTSDPILENVTVKNNVASHYGGGIYFGGDHNNPSFDSINWCNIYSNTAAIGQDLYSQYPPPSNSIKVVLDTFTVLNPTDFYVRDMTYFDLEIKEGLFDMVDNDLYISPDGDNMNSGLTPEEPLETLRYAFSLIRADSTHLNTIHLLEGKYSNTNEVNGYILPTLLPDYVNLEGESQESVKVDANGSSCVIEILNNSSNIISNLTITGGRYNGGIYVANSNLVLSNLKLYHNGGPGIYSLNSNLSVENSIISYNSGSGINLTDSYAIISQTEIKINNSSGRGGGIYCENSDLQLEKVTIVNNRAEYWGGGIYLSHSNPTIKNSLIDNNKAGNGGGIYCTYSSNPVIENVRIIDNDATNENGGGLYVSGSNPSLRNTVITGNYAKGVGGGIFCSGSNASLTNVTISDNKGKISGGAFYGVSSNSTFTNSILWYNEPEEIYFDNEGEWNSLTLGWTNIENGTANIETNNNGEIFWMDGCMAKDPHFVGEGDFQFQISDNSPCIDAGKPYTPSMPEFDPAGNPRLINGRIDIGAYEWNLMVDINNPGLNDPGKNEILVYPNPVVSTAKLNGQFTSSVIIKISIFNTSGNCLKSWDFANQQTENQEVTLNLGDLPTGIYFLRLQAGNEVVTKKVVKL